MFKTLKNAIKTPEVRKKLLYTLLLIVIFLPLLKEGFKLEVESSEENYITSRKKFNLLVFNEWINIVLVIILLILYTTIYL